jgi:hypothetical protein
MANALLGGLNQELGAQARVGPIKRKNLRDLPGLIERAIAEEAPREVLRAARVLSSGGYTSAMLRRMGHPYAKRAPNPPLPAYMINVQSGKFRDSWRCEVKRVGQQVTLVVTNDAPYAGYLFRGTRLMIERPILVELKKRVEPRLTQAIAQSIIRKLKA